MFKLSEKSVRTWAGKQLKVAGDAVFYLAITFLLGMFLQGTFDPQVATLSFEKSEDNVYMVPYNGTLIIPVHLSVNKGCFQGFVVASTTQSTNIQVIANNSYVSNCEAVYTVHVSVRGLSVGTNIPITFALHKGDGNAEVDRDTRQVSVLNQ